MRKNISKEPVQFEKHEPERRRGGGRVFCNGGCCCCSCCLHSLTGLVAAAVATSKGRSPTDRSVAGCYWTVLVVLALAVAFFASFASVALGVLAVVIFLPTVQLAASVLTCIWILARGPGFPDKRAALLTLGRITLWSFLGAVAGAVLMIVGLRMLG